MKQVTLELYAFEELNEKVQEKLIENYRQNIDYYHVYEWVIDDCYLLNPKGYDDLIIGNTRKVYFDLDRRTIDIEKGVEIEDARLFFEWLGIPADKDNFFWELGADTIYFEPDNYIENGEDGEFSDEDKQLFENAKIKFEEHCELVFDRIVESVRYYESDEYIKEELINSETYYTVTGKAIGYFQQDSNGKEDLVLFGNIFDA